MGRGGGGGGLSSGRREKEGQREQAYREENLRQPEAHEEARVDIRVRNATAQQLPHRQKDEAYRSNSQRRADACEIARKTPRYFIVKTSQNSQQFVVSCEYQCLLWNNTTSAGNWEGWYQ